jgi:hypothetical protein
MSIYLVWRDYKCLGYRGLETVVVSREEVKMMLRGYRYLVYRGLVNVIDKEGGECDGGWVLQELGCGDFGGFVLG